MNETPGEVSYSAAIIGCETAGLWQLALTFRLSSMSNMNETPGEISYSAAISGRETAGLWQLALTFPSGMPTCVTLQTRSL